jgi:hypothetical protein
VCLAVEGEEPDGVGVASTVRGLLSCSGQPSEEPSAPLLSRGFVLVVGTAGFEPATPCSQISALRAACQALFLQVVVERKPQY